MADWIMIGRGFAAILIALGGFIASMNWASLIATHCTGRFHSAVPLVGALLLGAGLALLPSTRHYAWAAILADYGTLILLFSLPKLVREEWRTSRHNLVAEYRGGSGITTACISLYRGGVCQHVLIQFLEQERDVVARGFNGLPLLAPGRFFGAKASISASTWARNASRPRRMRCHSASGRGMSGVPAEPLGA